MDLVIWRIGLQETTGLTGRATDIYGGSYEELVLFRCLDGIG